MDHREVGHYWNANADAWTRLSRIGCDVARDTYNTPTFLALLPDVAGLHGLDIGCGEGHNTRLLAQRGARMAAIDIAEKFVRHAREAEAEQPLGIDFYHASAVELPFADRRFDFATSFMCLMDLPEQDLALAEAFRVLRPNGFLQFSIIHPCFQPSGLEWVSDEDGKRTGAIVRNYFDPPWDIEEWTFSHTTEAQRTGLEPFRVPRFPRTLGWWLNTLLDTGFALERFAEPHPTLQQIADGTSTAGARHIALFLIVRVRKPA